MKRAAIALLMISIVGTTVHAEPVGTQGSYAGLDLYLSDSPDGHREKAIGMAKEICDKENLTWEDVTIKNLGHGRWRITVTSLEQGRTLMVEVDARAGIVLSKSVK